MRLRLFRGARYVSPPPRAREYLSRPLGRLYRPEELEGLREVITGLARDGTPVASVGDRVTHTLLDWGVVPDIAVVDCLERRSPVNLVDHRMFRLVVLAENLRGRVNTAILDLLGDVWPERPVLIRISGEEDLVGVPVILFMPESGHVLYGQPLEGVVDVVVSAPLKEELRRVVLGEEGV